MAITLVKAGAIATGTATVSPAFGQATTAGNLLVARLANISTSGTVAGYTTTATGWVQAVQTAGSDVAAIWYKPNCGAAETAPVFNDVGAGTIAADLLEFSGAATSNPVDKTGTGLAAATATSAADTASGAVAVAAVVWFGTKSATATFTDTWTPAGGTKVANQGTGATKSDHWMWGSAWITSANGSADSDTTGCTPSTGTPNLSGWAIASFKAAAASTPSLVFDDRRIRRNSLLRR